MDRATSRKIQEKEVLCQVKTIEPKQHGNENSQVSSQHKKWFDVKDTQQNKEWCSQCGDSTHVKAFSALQKFQCKASHRFGHFASFCYQKKQATFKSRKPKVHQLQTGAVYAKESGICSQSEDDSSSEDFFCLQVKVQCTQAHLQKIPRPAYLITNLAYRLKSHHMRNLYLRARLNTCGDINIMPASVYRLVLSPQKLRCLVPAV